MILYIYIYKWHACLGSYIKHFLTTVMMMRTMKIQIKIPIDMMIAIPVMAIMMRIRMRGME